MVQHSYMATGKTIALTIQTFVDKVMPLLFNMLSRLVIAFLEVLPNAEMCGDRRGCWATPAGASSSRDALEACFHVALPAKLWADAVTPSSGASER